MSPHVHIGLIHFVISWLGTIMIFGPIWRWLSARYSDSAIGKAMAFIY